MIGGFYHNWKKLNHINDWVIRKNRYFIYDAVKQHILTHNIENPKVLDIGCGTGTVASILASAGYDVLGIDLHEPTIQNAISHYNFPNLKFEVKNPMDIIDYEWDVIILSEVIEHVDSINAFLGHICSLLSFSGILLITLPNGYGPKEVSDSLYERYIKWGWLHDVFRALRRLFIKDKYWDDSSQKVSFSAEEFPHVNRFHWHEFLSLLAQCGFRMKYCRNSAWISGIVFFKPLFHILPKLKLQDCYIADKIPPQLASGWMSVLEKK